MKTRTLIPVEEYLSTVYRPDCDYVEGEVLERNLGERDHSYIQVALAAYFFARRKALNIEVFTEQRVQVLPNRFRIPDLCVVLGGTKEKIFTIPPFLCVEILSPEDRMVRMLPKIQEYLSIGVEWIWIVDPYEQSALLYSRQNPAGAVCDLLRTENPSIEIPLTAAFNLDD